MSNHTAGYFQTRLYADYVRAMSVHLGNDVVVSASESKAPFADCARETNFAGFAWVGEGSDACAEMQAD